MDKFTIDFWQEKVQMKDDGDIDLDGNHKVVRHEGVHYWIGSEGFVTENRSWLGHGGAEVRITFTEGPHKGLVVDTNNLWCQGSIEEEFKALLPDNAVIDWRYHYKKEMNKAN
jgi:hypothetical protein